MLDEAEAALAVNDWETVRLRVNAVLAPDPQNEDAVSYRDAADRASGSVADAPRQTPEARTRLPEPSHPDTFVAGRYRVERFLGDGAKKRVFLARDNSLDRQVAFAQLRTEGLDPMGRQRLVREAQAMARLGNHPRLVGIFDIGEEGGTPFIVEEYMEGGDLAAQLQEAEGGLALPKVLTIGQSICEALAFIHERQLLHRDLKPSNVFLAEDGSAKVGDFGLAVSLDRSRLTTESSLIGTPSYMPPEQALGGAVTERSDLYSLGAMLYELVTGRPPFVGDDPTSVISQHINTRPVAPSWHSEHCPPELEAIILQCLEKAPESRPASAAEVREALAKVDPEGKSSSHSGSSANPLDRLAQGVFVGRTRELERLRTAFDNAFAGHGNLVMLVGEPGIGKTRTARELETYARMRGAQVLWGRSHEQSGAPAFWPWVQVGGQWGQANDLDSLAPFVASGGNELARLFPALRTVPGFIEPQPMADGAAAQFRLFDAFAGFVRLAAENKPLVVTLDDLHWSDKPTLLLLQHLARELSRTRCLVVCTYRDTDLTRTHPLSEALAELNRDPGFERIVLRGLERLEVKNYIATAAHLQPSPVLVERVYEETEGNPFFLTEVVNLLAQEGTLNDDSLSDIRIPDGVKQALGRRLDRLSDDANELLQIAAIAGREFTYGSLELLHQGGADTLLELIEEGLAARVIEEMPQSGRYRFTHALMQETLLGELSTTRRVRLHGQVGEALEKRLGDRADEFASRLANHFSESATLTDSHADKALRYLEVAANSAEERFAWAAAALCYERRILLAREAGRPLGPLEEGDQLVAASRCHIGALEFRAAWRSMRRALSLFEEVQEGQRYAHAVAAAMLYPSPTLPPAARRLELLEQALRYVDPTDSETKALLWLAKAEANFYLGDYAGTRALLDDVAEVSQLSGSPLIAGEFARMQSACSRQEGGDAEVTFAQYESAAQTLLQAGYPSRAAEALYFLGTDTLNGTGELGRAARTLEELSEIGRRAGLSAWIADSKAKLLGIAVFRGSHDRVASIVADPPPDLTFVWGMYLAYYDVLMGRADRLERDLPTPDAAGNIPWMTAQIHACRAECYWLAGDEGRTKAESQALHALVPRVEGAFRESAQLASAYITEVLLGEQPDPDGTLAVTDLTPVMASSMYVWMSNIPRILGEIAMARHDLESARAFLDRALAWSVSENCDAEAGRCLLALADLEIVRGNEAAAVSHLDNAAQRFRDYGAAAFVDRAINRKLELQGLSDTDPNSSILAVSSSVAAERPDISVDAAPDGTVTLMFSDIVDSTALNERLGDTAWMALLREHSAIVEREVAAHHGHIVKSMGDGFMVAFPSAREGLRCAIALQRAFTARNDSADQPIEARIGLHTGEAVRDHGDFFGKHVNLAARIGASAGGGEIVVSSLLAQLVEPSGEFALEPRKARSFKGLEGEHVTYGVEANG